MMIPDIWTDKKKKEEKDKKSFVWQVAAGLPGMNPLAAAKMVQDAHSVAKAAKVPLPPAEHVLWTLGWLDSPRNAVAGSLYNMTDRDPATPAWKGFKEGLAQKTRTTYGDVLGIPHGKPTDSWPVYLGKEGAHLGLDIAFDPLNVLGFGGLLAKAGKAAKVPKLVEKIGGTWVGRDLFHQLGGKYKEVENALQGVRAGASGELRLKVHEQTKQALDQFKSFFKDAKMGKDEQRDFLWDLWQKAERPQQEGLNVPDWALDALMPLRKTSREGAEMVKSGREKLGIKTRDLIRDVISDPKKVPYYGFLPRLVTSAAAKFKKSGIGIPGLDPSALEDIGRVLALWVDAGALAKGKKIVHPYKDSIGSFPIVGRADDPRTMVQHRAKSIRTGKERPGGYWYFEMPGPDVVKVPERVTKEGRVIPGHLKEYKHQQGLKRVHPVQASLADVREVYPELGEAFLDKPVDALMMDSLNKANRIEFLDLVDRLKTMKVPQPKNLTPEEVSTQGRLRRFFGKEELEDLPVVLDTREVEQLPKGYRKLAVPGMEHFAAPKWPANRLEQLAKVKYDKNTPSGKLEEALSKFYGETWMGQKLKDYNTWWKRNVLGLHPGFYSANVVSDASLAFLGGQHNLPGRSKDAWQMMQRSPKEVVPGMSGEELLKEAVKRNVAGSSWAESEVVGDVGRQLQDRNYKKLAGWMGGRSGKALESVGENWEKLNDLAFKHIGGKSSDFLRLGLFSDRIKKGMKAGQPLDENLLNDAARATKDFMIDYGDLTGLETQIKNVIPFYAWYRGLLGRTVKDLGERPEKMAHLGRIYDFLFNPMKEEDRKVAPDYIKEKAPVTGILGKDFPKTKEGLPYYLKVGRFMPHGTTEELFNRPGEAAFNMIGPAYKGLAELWGNRSYFFDSDIDPAAGSGFHSLVNPPLDLGARGARKLYQMATGQSGEGNLPIAPWAPAYSKMFGRSIPAGYDYLLRQLNPAGRLLGAANTLAKATGIEAFQDPMIPSMSGKGALAWWLTGGKFKPFDREKQAKHRWYDYAQKKKTLTYEVKKRAAKGDQKNAEHALLNLYKFLKENPQYQKESPGETLAKTLKRKQKTSKKKGDERAVQAWQLLMGMAAKSAEAQQGPGRMAP